MSRPADDQTTLLRERLARLADSVDGGDSIDGAQLYHRALRRRRRRIVITAGLATAGVVIAGAALGSVVRPNASPPEKIAPADTPSNPPSPPPSSDTSSGCQLSDTLAEVVDLGMMTRKEACRVVKRGEQAEYAREHPEEFSKYGGQLVVEGYAHADLVADCRAGRTITSEHNDITCNALIMIADGELEPNGTCGPPACPEEGTPLWHYTVAELRDLAGRGGTQ
jgi:hypothetical protein